MDSIPYGYCHCGCGEKTTLQKKSYPALGITKGEPCLYLHQHHRRMRERYRIEDCGYETPCWVWQGSPDKKGYGRAKRDGKTCLAHHFTFEQAKGPIPEGLELDHLCRNPPCVNPDHLEAVTRSVNQRRAIAANGLKTHCKRGHEFSPENTSSNGKQRICRACMRMHSRNKRLTHPRPKKLNWHVKGEQSGSAKLKEADVRSILARYAAGEPISQIARDYPVTHMCVYHVVIGRTWQHIERP